MFDNIREGNVFTDTGIDQNYYNDYYYTYKPGIKRKLKQTFPHLRKAVNKLKEENIPIIANYAKQHGYDVQNYLSFMLLETAFTLNEKVRNPTSSASGLCQLMDYTARGQGLSIHKFRKMSALQQLNECEIYLKKRDPLNKRFTDLGVLYTLITAPKYKYSSDDTPVYSLAKTRKAYLANLTWDIKDKVTKKRDGIIYKGEFKKAASIYSPVAKVLLEHFKKG